MEAVVADSKKKTKVWGGGPEVQPYNVSYGKLMMWLFIVSDALTFTGFLAAYGFIRFKFYDTWPIADEVFTHIPFYHGSPQPMIYVAFMSFVLVASSVTMVLAVDAGHKMNQKKVSWYLFATIIGGLIFLGSQAWEWSTFIKGEYGAVETKSGSILQFVDAKTHKQISIHDFVKAAPDIPKETNVGPFIPNLKEKVVPEYTVEQVVNAFKADKNILIRGEKKNKDDRKIVLSREASLKALSSAKDVVFGANLVHNEYGKPLFGDFFFFITGFHGFHVFSGIVINIIIFLNVLIGTYERRKSYEMVEKTGLYWHFVDLVWVFVFTFFYLV